MKYWISKAVFLWFALSSFWHQYFSNSPNNIGTHSFVCIFLKKCPQALLVLGSFFKSFDCWSLVTKLNFHQFDHSKHLWAMSNKLCDYVKRSHFHLGILTLHYSLSEFIWISMKLKTKIFIASIPWYFIFPYRKECQGILHFIIRILTRKYN